MKPANFLVVFCATFSTLLIIGCGGNADKTEAKTPDSASSTTAIEQSNIVTTTQHMMEIKHKVSNYAKWKPVYDSDDSARLANGIHKYVISRGTQDSNMIMVAFKTSGPALVLASI